MSLRVLRILVVDDHEVVREATRSILEHHGFDVVGEASDGAEAIRNACLLEPNVVVMDINMPRIDGLEATRLIKLLFPDTKVVVTSACEEESILARVKAAGASAFVRKGSLIDALVAAIVACEELFVAAKPQVL